MRHRPNRTHYQSIISYALSQGSAISFELRRRTERHAEDHAAQIAGSARERNPETSGLHLPLSPQSAHELDVFLHAISDPAYRAKLKAGPPLEDGALQLVELADDEAVMADLVDAGLAVFDFLSGHRTKQEVKVSHDRALGKVRAISGGRAPPLPGVRGGPEGLRRLDGAR